MTPFVRKFIVIALLAAAPAPALGNPPTQPRNDTGQDLCYDVSGTVVACESQSEPGQDGRFGRDSAAAGGALPKSGAGAGGFDYTKIANDGSKLPADAALGSGPQDWACTLDNLTGRLWEIKTNDGGLRHGQWTYHWFDPDDARNGGDAGEQGGFELGCNFTMECNTQAYIDYVDSIALCGRSDWRLPSLDELTGIVNFGSPYPPGAVDITYFPDGGYGGAWTADTGMEPDASFAWMINFDDGHAEAAPKGGLLPIRVVSAEPYIADGPAPVCGERENPQIPATTAGAFTDNGDGTVSDARTGLVWDRCSVGQDFSAEGGDKGNGGCDGEPQPMNWEQALQEVVQRNESGHLGWNDWRLPNIKELASLQERRCAMPTLDVVVFPNSSMETYWSSTSYLWSDQFDLAWIMTGEFGALYAQPKESESRVRLVRSGAPFDDYQGAPTYRVGGAVSGMVGSGLVLRLDADDGDQEMLPVAANGAFAFAHGFVAGDSYSVSVSQSPLPAQECAIENAQGTISDDSIGNVTVTCAAPDPAVIAASPAAFAFDVIQDGSASASLGIANTGGGILHWNIATAYANTTSVAAEGNVVDCAADSDIIIHDDGTPDQAYGGNVSWQGGVAIVDKFTPPTYPASIRSACFALAGSAGVSALDFEIVVFADNGADGAPGTELGALAVSATGLPQYPVGVPAWRSYDISSLYTTIASGSVYVGIRWQPVSVNNRIYLLADESADRPVGYAGGYYWNWSGSGAWQPIQNAFTDYRSMFIRAVAGDAQPLPVGCDDPHAVPWLDVSPAAGMTLAGQSSEVGISVHAAGLALGDYSARLCIASDDATGNGLVEVPVTMHVAQGIGALAVAPTAIDFGVAQVGSTTAARTVTVSNTGTDALGAISPAVAQSPFGRSGGDCPPAPFALAPAQSCTIDYVFVPAKPGSQSQSLAVKSDGGSLTIALAGTGVPGAAAQLVAISGNGQSAETGQPFTLPLTVEVRDAFGNAVPGAAVHFDVPASGPSAILSASMIVTGTDGRAAVHATANGYPGSYFASATLSAPAEVVDFALTNRIGDRIFEDGFDVEAQVVARPED